jgi:hypothetical protein
MNVIASRATTVERGVPTYFASEPHESEWGQPPASQYWFYIDGTRMYGQPISEVYLQSSSMSHSVVHSKLAAEFEAWEAASDEAMHLIDQLVD